MPNSPYRLATDFTLRAPVARVWQELDDAGSWPLWWPSAERVEEISRDPRAVRLVIGSFFYRLDLVLTTTELVEDIRSAFDCSGALVGSGVMNFSETDGLTSVEFEWDVRTNKPWMNLASRFARPFFIYSHERVMRKFVRGLAERLGAEIVSERTYSK